MMTRPAAWLTVAALFTAAACREEGITRVREPKEGAPVLAAPARPARGLAWTVPSGWKELPGTGMRLATFVPPAGLKTEATLVALPGDVGGELANVNRWRGQLALPPFDAAGMNAARKTVATKAGAATLYDFTGAGEKPSRLLAATVTAGGTTWFFKLMGDAAATESARAGFLALVASARPDAAK